MKKIENILIPLFIGLMILISFLFFMYFSTFKYISLDTAVWGAFGDYIGGLLNPIFAFLSFTALIITLLYQHKQLEQNREILQETIKAIEQNEKALSQNQEALEFNRIELENSNKQLELSAKAQVEIEKTQKIQQFDMLFTTLLSELNFMNTNFIEKGQIIEFYKIFESNDRLEYKQVDLRKKYQLTRYFIILYQALKQINDTNFLKDEEKKKYSNIVRASLENSLLQLLMLNCNCDGYKDDFKEFYFLLERFSFLEHMDFQDLTSENYKLNFDLLLCLKNYKKEVFGKSIYLDSVKKIWYYPIVTKKNSTISKYQFFLRLIYMRPIILSGEINGFKVILDFIRYKGRFVKLHIFEISSNIEESFIIDLTNLNVSFYSNNIYASVEVDEINIRFEINKDNTVAYVKFNFSFYRELPFKSSFKSFNEISLKKVI